MQAKVSHPNGYKATAPPAVASAPGPGGRAAVPAVWPATPATLARAGAKSPVAVPAVAGAASVPVVGLCTPATAVSAGASASVTAEVTTGAGTATAADSPDETPAAGRSVRVFR